MKKFFTLIILTTFLLSGGSLCYLYFQRSHKNQNIEQKEKGKDKEKPKIEEGKKEKKETPLIKKDQKEKVKEKLKKKKIPITCNEVNFLILAIFLIILYVQTKKKPKRWVRETFIFFFHIPLKFFGKIMGVNGIDENMQKNLDSGHYLLKFFAVIFFKLTIEKLILPFFFAIFKNDQNGHQSYKQRLQTIFSKPKITILSLLLDVLINTFVYIFILFMIFIVLTFGLKLDFHDKADKHIDEERNKQIILDLNCSTFNINKNIDDFFNENEQILNFENCSKSGINENIDDFLSENEQISNFENCSKSGINENIDDFD